MKATDISAEECRALIRELDRLGYIEVAIIDGWPGHKLTEKGWEALTDLVGRNARKTVTDV